MAAELTPDAVRETVHATYAERARRVAEGETDGSCCRLTSACRGANADPITSSLYACDEVAAIPEAALKASLGCVAGALEECEYRRMLSEVGFEAVEVEVTRVYDAGNIAESARGEWDAAAFASLEASGGRLVSAFVRARKPAAD